MQKILKHSQTLHSLCSVPYSDAVMVEPQFVQFFFQSLHACLAQSMNVSIQGHVENTTDDLALHVCKI